METRFCNEQNETSVAVFFFFLAFKNPIFSDMEKHAMEQSLIGEKQEGEGVVHGEGR
jgi:hypothetical protein